MKKVIFIPILLLGVYFSSGAQTAAKSVYAEIGGPGLASLNYDMRLNRKNDGLGIRVGIGGFSIRTTYHNTYTERSTILFFPAEVNYLLGKEGKNHLELGAGCTLISGTNNAKDSDNGFTERSKFYQSFGHLYFGYRKQPFTRGFMFRMGIVPLFGKGFFWPYYGGVSFGYKF